jgi:hypothetical protein
MRCIYVGAVFSPAADYENWLNDVRERIGQRATTEATIQKNCDIQLAKDPEEAHEYPFTGLVAGVHVDSDQGNNVFSLESDPAVPLKRGQVAAPFVDWLLSQFPEQFGDSLWFNEDVQPETYIFGFGIKKLLKMACMEVHYNNARSSTPTRLPVRLWRNVRGVYDPITDVILPTQTEERRMGYDKLFEYYNINARWDDIASNPSALAAVAKLVVEKAQLV